MSRDHIDAEYYRCSNISSYPTLNEIENNCKESFLVTEYINELNGMFESIEVYKENNDKIYFLGGFGPSTIVSSEEVDKMIFGIKTKKSKPLSVGAIVGIVLGVIAITVILIFIGVFELNKKKVKRRQDDGIRI